ncbi:MAG: hypothetical protein KatS3mg065_1063 [Chloroflexota bacterium]|nr:MAG: hypothetical protein KatS3mg065_1063 [Chloroflexota bacterium]
MSARGDEASTGQSVRDAIRGWLEAKGHAVENARRALEVLERGQAAGEIPRTPALERMVADLRAALEVGRTRQGRSEERGGGPPHPPGHRPGARSPPLRIE